MFSSSSRELEGKVKNYFTVIYLVQYLQKVNPLDKSSLAPNGLQSGGSFFALQRNVTTASPNASVSHHFQQMLHQNSSIACNVSAVRVEGAAHTRKSFLASIINPAIPPPNPPLALQPNTLEDVLHAARRISYILKKTDIFTSVEAHIDLPRDPLALPGDVDLVFKTKERGRLYASSSTELGNNEGSAVCFIFYPYIPINPYFHVECLCTDQKHLWRRRIL